MAKLVMIVDDDPPLRRSLGACLERAGYRAQAAGTAEEGLALAQEQRPDLVLLETGLPDMDGLQALREFHARCAVPVIFLAGQQRMLDEALALELGAADYLTKPFNNDVLLARMRAALLRALPVTIVEPRPVTVGDLTVDPRCGTVTLARRPVDLPPRAFDLLYTLAADAGQALPLDHLLSRVWGDEYRGATQVVYVQIRGLRQKLERDPNRPRRLLTIHGVGYKLVPQEA